MGEAKDRNTVEALRGEVVAVRQANEGLRQKVREYEARLLRLQAQSQDALARAEQNVVDLRIALSRYLSADAASADAEVAKHQPAGQVAAGPKQG